MNKTLEELKIEAKGLVHGFHAGTLTAPQKQRMLTLQDELKAATETRSAQDLLDALNSRVPDAEGSRGAQVKRLTPEALNRTAKDLAGQIQQRSASLSEPGVDGTGFITSGTFSAAPGGAEGLYVAGNHVPELSRNVFASMTALQHDQARYTYLRQSTRSHKAATVAEGALKPESDYGFEKVTQDLKVFAHLTKGLPEMLLEDSEALVRFIGQELMTGLMAEVDRQIITGDGTSDAQRDDITGLAHTPGILNITPTKPGASVMKLVRQAVTAITLQGGAADTVYLSPVDFEELETTEDADGRYLYTAAPWFSEGNNSRLWGLRVVVTSAVPVGVAYVVDSTALAFSTDTHGVRLAVTNQAGDLFARNQVAFRCEMRANLDVFVPRSVAKVTFEAPAAE